MSIFVGFSTQEVDQVRTIETTGAYGGSGTTKPSQPNISKKFKLTDEKLVIRDLINAFSIKQGEKVGQPDYGTTLWGYLFEQNIPDTRSAMETEIRRVIAQDSRIILNSVAIQQQENGVLFEVEVAFQPFNNPMNLVLSLDKNSGIVSLVT